MLQYVPPRPGHPSYLANRTVSAARSRPSSAQRGSSGGRYSGVLPVPAAGSVRRSERGVQRGPPAPSPSFSSAVTAGETTGTTSLGGQRSYTPTGTTTAFGGRYPAHFVNEQQWRDYCRGRRHIVSPYSVGGRGGVPSDAAPGIMDVNCNVIKSRPRLSTAGGRPDINIFYDRTSLEDDFNKRYLTTTTKDGKVMLMRGKGRVPGYLSSFGTTGKGATIGSISDLANGFGSFDGAKSGEGLGAYSPRSGHYHGPRDNLRSFMRFTGSHSENTPLKPIVRSSSAFSSSAISTFDNFNESKFTHDIPGLNDHGLPSAPQMQAKRFLLGAPPFVPDSFEEAHRSRRLYY